MYEVRCIFCALIHRSEFWEEVENGIMRCRETAPGYKRGDLRDFQHKTVTNPEVPQERQEYVSCV